MLWPGSSSCKEGSASFVGHLGSRRVDKCYLVSRDTFTHECWFNTWSPPSGHSRVWPPFNVMSRYLSTYKYLGTYDCTVFCRQVLYPNPGESGTEGWGWLGSSVFGEKLRSKLHDPDCLHTFELSSCSPPNSEVDCSKVQILVVFPSRAANHPLLRLTFRELTKEGGLRSINCFLPRQ